MTYQPKSYRKFLATSVAAAMVATVAAPMVLADFADVSEGSYYSDAVDYLVEKGVLEGFPDGSFQPNAGVTRAQASKILVETLGLEVPATVELGFTDTKDDVWYSGYVAALVAAGIVEGNPDGTFAPGATITRAELAKMVVEAYELEQDADVEIPFTDTANGAWYQDHVNTLYSLGIVNGMTPTSFAPSATVTRGQAAVFVYRTEVEAERLEVEVVVPTPTELAVASVMAINDTRIELTFNKAVDADLALEIEKSGKRFVVYNGGETVNSSTNIQSRTISFNADRTKVSILLDGTPKTDINYRVALLNGDNNQVSSLVVESSNVILKRGASQPIITVNAEQDKFILKFDEKMATTALTVLNYEVYENNTLVGPLSDFVTGDGDWEDSTEKKAVEFRLNSSSTKKLLAGKNYRVKVNINVETDKGTALSESQRLITVTTPSVSEAQPVAKLARIVSGDLVVTFDKDVANSNFNNSQISVKKPSGQTINVTSVNAGTTSKEIIIRVSETLDTDLTYTIDLPANGVANAVFPNASNREVTGLRAQAQADVEVRSVAASLVRQVANSDSADLLLTFDQRVDVQDLKVKSTSGQIVIKEGSDVFQYVGSGDVLLYHGDTTGRTVIFKNVSTQFQKGNDAFQPRSGKTYKVELAAQVVRTDSGEMRNLEKISADFSGLSVIAPVLDKVRLESAGRIVLEFKENIDARNLKASDITVQGFERYRGGNFSPTALRGDYQLNFSVSGKTLTLTPASSDIKFSTGNVGSLVVIARDTIKSIESGVENAILNTDDVAANDMIDRAAPEMVGAIVNSTSGITITYTEKVNFKGSDVNLRALQYTVDNASKNAYGIVADANTEQITVTFNETDTFRPSLDLSKVNLVYTKNTNSAVRDLAGNEASTQTINGLKVVIR
jgi:hypothetical protein